MRNMQITGQDITAIPVLVTNLEKMCFWYNRIMTESCSAFDFLSLQKIGFNFVTRKMYIWK